MIMVKPISSPFLTLAFLRMYGILKRPFVRFQRLGMIACIDWLCAVRATTCVASRVWAVPFFLSYIICTLGYVHERIIHWVFVICAGEMGYG